MDPDASCVIRADERETTFQRESWHSGPGESLCKPSDKEYLIESTFTEHSHTESLPIRVKKTYHLTWREDHGHSTTTYCGSDTFYHVKGTYCTDTDGDGINDSCPGHPYTGCRDTDGDGVADHCPGHSGWESNWVGKSDTAVVYSDAHSVNRSYSYWTVDQFETYVPDKAVIYNNALPDGKVELEPDGIPQPAVTLTHSQDQSNHVLNDPFSDAIANNTIIYDDDADCYVVDLGDESLNGGTSKPNIPEIQNYISLAENAVPDYKTRNDLLMFNGETILDDTQSENGDTPDPRNIPEGSRCDENAFYNNQLTRPDATLNGTHDTTGTVTYRRLSEAIDPVHEQMISLPITANSVTVHTPVVCNSGVRDESFIDQSLNPDRNRAALVLGAPFIRFLTNGEHLDLPGYNANGTMDCRKYTRDGRYGFPSTYTSEPMNHWNPALCRRIRGIRCLWMPRLMRWICSFPHGHPKGTIGSNSGK